MRGSLYRHGYSLARKRRGRAVLAHVSFEGQTALVGHKPDHVLDELADVRSRSYLISDGAVFPGSTIGGAILDAAAQPIAAVVLAPSERMPADVRKQTGAVAREVT